MKVFDVIYDFLREFDLENAIYEKMSTEEIISAIIHLNVDEDIKLNAMRCIVTTLNLNVDTEIDYMKLNTLELAEHILTQLKVNMTLVKDKKLSEFYDMTLGSMSEMKLSELMMRKERIE